PVCESQVTARSRVPDPPTTPPSLSALALAIGTGTVVPHASPAIGAGSARAGAGDASPIIATVTAPATSNGLRIGISPFRFKEVGAGQARERAPSTGAYPACKIPSGVVAGDGQESADGEAHEEVLLGGAGAGAPGRAGLGELRHDAGQEHPDGRLGVLAVEA